MADADRKARAEARRTRAILNRTRLQTIEPDACPVRGVEAMSLVTRLTREGWGASGAPNPTHSNDTLPIARVTEAEAEAARVIELPDDFRDVLVELVDAAAEFVLLGGYAVAFHGHPRASKGFDLLIKAESANADRVFRGLAAFGAPSSAFDVRPTDFVTHDGVLQIGLPPRRIDILNRADGITFDEAIADGDHFEVEGRRIPVIGLRALLTNKRAAGRPHDLADVAALESIASVRP